MVAVLCDEVSHGSDVPRLEVDPLGTVLHLSAPWLKGAAEQQGSENGGGRHDQEGKLKKIKKWWKFPESSEVPRVFSFLVSFRKI